MRPAEGLGRCRAGGQHFWLAHPPTRAGIWPGAGQQGGESALLFEVQACEAGDLLQVVVFTAESPALRRHLQV